MIQYQNYYFFCVQQGVYVDGQCIFWYQIYIVVEEVGVCYVGFMGQGFNMGVGCQRRGWFVKCDMIIVVYVVYEQVDFIVGMNFFFIVMVFCIDVWCVIIQQVDIFCWNINVVKEIMVYKVMIVFWMFFWQVNVFIYVKGDDVFEVNLVCFMYFNQCFVGGQWGIIGWQIQDEWMVCGWFKCINVVNDMVGSLFIDLFSGYQGNQFYFLFLQLKQILVDWCQYFKESIVVIVLIGVNLC